MDATFQNSGTALSIGVFFSLMVAGLARSLPDTLTGTEFFPQLIAEPFHHGLVTVFTAAAGMALAAALASASRGRRYLHQERASIVIATGSGASHPPAG